LPRLSPGARRPRRESRYNLLNEKVRPYVEPLPGVLGAELFLPLEVRETPQMTGVFAAIWEKWGRLDFLIHSLAFAPRRICKGVWSTARSRAS
jgi:enoyl-[acyl-carrier-protein] reductase (NADH)